MKTKTITKLLLCALPAACIQHGYATDLENNLENNFEDINKIDAGKQQFQQQIDDKLQKKFEQEVQKQYVLERMKLSLKKRYEDKENEQQDNARYYNTLYLAIAEDMANCYLRQEDFANSGDLISLRIYAKNGKCSAISPADYKFSQPQWSRLILQNLLQDLSNQPTEDSISQQTIEAEILKIRASIEEKCAKSCADTISTYDSLWKQKLWGSAKIVRNYVRDLGLAELLKEAKEDDWTTGLDFDKRNLIATGQIPGDGINVNCSYTYNSELGKVDIARTLAGNTSDLVFKYKSNMTAQISSAKNFHRITKYQWKNAMTNIQDVNEPTLRLMHMVNASFGLLYNSPACRHLIQEISTKQQKELDQEESHYVRFVKELNDIYMLYDSNDISAAQDRIVKLINSNKDEKGNPYVFLKDDSFNSSYVKWEVVMQKVINILYSAATECGLQGQIPFTMQKIKEGEKDVLKPYVYDKSGTIDAMDAMYTNIDTLQIGKIAFRTQTEYQTRSFRFSAYSEANMPSTFSVTNKNGDKKTYLLTGLIKSGYLTIDRNNLTPVYLVSQTEAEELKKDSNKKLKQSTGVIGLYELIEQGETDDDDDED